MASPISHLAVVLLLLPLVFGVEFNGTLTLGVSLSLTYLEGTTPAEVALGRNIRDAIEASVTVYNELGGIEYPKGSGRYRKLQAVILDDHGFYNSTGAFYLERNYRKLCDMLQAGEVNFLLGPVNSDLTSRASPITEKCNGGVPLLYTSASSHKAGLNPRYAASVLPPADTSQLTSLQLLALSGAATAYMVKEPGAPTQMCDGAMKNAPGLGIRVLGNSTIQATTSITPAQQSFMDTVVMQLKAINPDALFVCGFPGNVMPLLKTMKRFNWYPKAVSVVPNNAQFTSYVEQRAAAIKKGANPDDWADVEYTLAGTTWHQDANYAPSYPWGTVKQFIAELSKRLNRNTPDWSYYALGASAVQVAVATLQSAPSLSQADLAYALSRVQVDTVMGPESFRVDGLSTNSFISSQWFQDERRVVAPITSRSFVMVYPAPSWEERSYNPKFLESSKEVGVFVAAIIAVVLLLLMAFCIFWYRDQRIIKAASWQMCIVMILGAALTCASVMVWQPYATDGMCHAQLWMFGVGEALWIGSLLVKTLRIHKIFNTTVLRVTKGTKNMLITFAVIVGIDILLLLIWSAAFGPKAQARVVDPFRPSLNYLTCTSPNDAISAVYIAYKVLIVVITTVLAYRVRNVPGEFNESKVIALGAYNFILCGLVIIVVVSFGGNSDTQGGRDFVFLFRSLGILLVAIADMGIIFGPRLYTIWFDKKMLAAMTGANNTVMAVTPNHRTPGAKYQQPNMNHSMQNMSVPGSHPSAVDADGGVSRARGSGHERVPLIVHIDETIRAADDLIKAVDHADQQEFNQNKRSISNLISKLQGLVSNKSLLQVSESGSSGPREGFTPRVVVVGATPRTHTNSCRLATPRSQGAGQGMFVATTARGDDSVVDFASPQLTTSPTDTSLPLMMGGSNSSSSTPPPADRESAQLLRPTQLDRTESDVPGVIKE